MTRNPATEETGAKARAERLLDEAMPRYDVATVQSIHVPASALDTFAALKAVTWNDVALARPLGALRTLPARLRGTAGPAPARPAAPIFAGGTPDIGFLMLGERTNEEILIGAIGKFWESDPSVSMKAVAGTVRTPAEFRAFATPEYVKVVASFSVQPEASGARVRVDTRIVGTDAAATARFHRYWRVIQPGEALLMRSLLRAVARHAAPAAPGGQRSGALAVTLCASALAGSAAVCAQRGKPIGARLRSPLPFITAAVPWVALLATRALRQRRDAVVAATTATAKSTASLLDDVLPVYESHLLEDITIARPRHEVWTAFREVTLADMPLARALGTARGVPSAILGLVRRTHEQAPSRLDAQQSFVAQVLDNGSFTQVAEDDQREIVWGAIGRFWRPDYGPHPIRQRDEFTAFDQPGFAKLAISVRAEDAPEGTRLIMESRVHGTSPSAAHTFARYWMAIGLGAHLVVRSLLRAIRRRATRPMAVPNATAAGA